MTDHATCSTCGLPVIWAVHTSGRRAPFDAEPDPAGLWELAREGDTIVTRFVGMTGPRLDLTPPGDVLPGYYMPHFATCPEADEHRKAKR